eukprot:Awhi_evm1s2695
MSVDYIGGRQPSSQSTISPTTAEEPPTYSQASSSPGPQAFSRAPSPLLSSDSTIASQINLQRDTNTKPI